MDSLEVIREIISKNKIDKIQFRGHFQNCGENEYLFYTDSFEDYKQFFDRLRKINDKYILSFESKVLIEGRPFHIQ